MCIFRCLYKLKTFSHESREYQHDLNELFFLQKMKGKDSFSFCCSSLNDISQYLKEKKLGFTAGRTLILHALVCA